MSDVIDLTSEKEKRKKGSKENSGPNQGELCYRAALAMMRQALDWSPFKDRFELIKPPNSEPYFIRVDSDPDGAEICSPVTDLEIQSSILHYFNTNPQTRGAAMLPKDCDVVFKFWQLLAVKKPFPEEAIFPIRFKSESGVTWRRLEFDPELMPTPMWDELMSRVSTPDVVMAFIGSLFVPESNRQQWLCLHGQGRNGKSRIAAFLTKCLAAGAQTAAPPKASSRFWNAQLLGKRLVTFADCGDLKFLNTANFKNLTGSDRVSIERKGKDVFDAAINCKFLVISNEKPEIKNTVSEKRRALYSEVAAFEGKEINPDVYDRLLWEEAPGILYKCLLHYRALAPDHGPIPFASEAFDDLIAEGEEELEHRARRWFLLWPVDAHKDVAFNDRPFVRPEYMTLIKRYERLSDSQYAEFKAFLERSYGVHRRRVRVGGNLEYRYLNCKENPDPPMVVDDLKCGV
jgi:hypothetical protein